ncbi:MAG: hypothetical protein ACK559_00735, partial [bacterium]
ASGAEVAERRASPQTQVSLLIVDDNVLATREGIPHATSLLLLGSDHAVHDATHVENHLDEAVMAEIAQDSASGEAVGVHAAIAKHVATQRADSARRGREEAGLGEPVQNHAHEDTHEDQSPVHETVLVARVGGVIGATQLLGLAVLKSFDVLRGGLVAVGIDKGHGF